VRKTTLHTPRSAKKEGEEVLQMLEQKFPLQPVMKTMVRQAVPLHPMEVHGRADIYLQPIEDPTMEKMGRDRVVLVGTWRLSRPSQNSF